MFSSSGFFTAMLVSLEAFSCFSSAALMSSTLASTKARMELLGARLGTRTLRKSLCASDFLNNSLS
ncbi:hypothetical protein EYF80_057304 [Liparis tanakae]|uniref:Secreted protein n=1 Tax=Liparis tanakae TaxID=230148 RepID=A0A4Z2EUD5_9TELE|nr:hypothetical protein EYF80_057304 [Liparis tanakae]